jgi:hypothetical protein
MHWRPKRLVKALLAAALAAPGLAAPGLAAGASVEAPAILTPGGTVAVPDFPDGVVLVATKVENFGGGAGPAGVLTEYVVTDSAVNPFGYHDVAFAFSLSLSSGDVVKMSLPGYAAFDTAVKSCNSAVCIEGTGTPPDTATRSANGDIVSFLWGTPLTTTSAGFVIYTNANSFIDPPSAQIIDLAGDVSLAPVFLPSTVPEPAGWALMLIGVGLIGSVMRRARAAGHDHIQQFNLGR